MKIVKLVSSILIGLCVAGLAVVFFLIPPSTEQEPHLSERKRRLTGELRMNAPDRFAEYHRSIRTRPGEAAPAYPPNYKVQALQKAWTKSGAGVVGKKHAARAPLNWIERGPSNVAGRARAILVDPDDPDRRTWYAGSASGGVWKTADAGQSWRELTRNLPNLATTTLAMPASNPDVLYAGTGEGYGAFAFVYGQGIWKSSDKGETWTQLAGTSNDPAFTNVLRLIVDPDDENLLVAATSTGLRRASGEEGRIMRSTNGGVSWEQVYSSPDRVEQVLMSPDNFLVQYATVNGKGILKSTDGGVTWTEDFEAFFEVGRLEMAVAPSNPARLYVSAENGLFTATLFLSDDAGETWEVMDNPGGDELDWLGELGWYSNAITVDPINADRVFAAGLDIYQFDIGSTFTEKGYVVDVIETDPTQLFRLDLASAAPDIAKRLGQPTEVLSAEFLEVEVRWGPGITQKAHRFEEKWFGAYINYVDVAFEVWDVKNNRQLMAAYEDEDRDMQWDISGALIDASERIIILDVPYNQAGPHIPTTVNAFTRAIYVLTVTSESDDEIDHGPFPDASMRIVPDIRPFRDAEVQQITAGYSGDAIASKGVHVDHHQLIILPADDANATPILLDANDGGVAVSYDMGSTFIQTGDTFSQLYDGVGGSGRPLRGLNTAQFFGVDKMNGADRYVGGTQDNGSWVSPPLTTNNEPWVFAPSSDGFEAVWHYANPDWIIQSSQFNKMYRTRDGGLSWQEVTPPGSSVFLTRIAKTNKDPDLIISATPIGIVRSEDFGSTWERIQLVGIWPSDASPTVRISLATPNVVWAGAELGGNTSFFVSEDRGASFEGIPGSGKNYGVITDIATHPSEPQTAYALFSFAGAPKILRTTDLGQTWEDLSGFGDGAESTNGFPDVAVYSLLVMPYDNQIMWAGTEIGIFESTDGGASWHFSESGFPAVAVWQMHIVNDQVVVATHGRGVWTVQLPELAGYEPSAITLGPVIQSTRGGANGRVDIDLELRTVYDSTLVLANGEPVAVVPANAEKGVQQVALNLSVVAQEVVQLSASGYIAGQATPSTPRSQTLYTLNPVQTSFVTNFESADDDFVLDGFVFSEEAGFENKAMHSSHPYPDFEDVTAVLRTPVLVDENYPILSFDEIALVEAGKEDAPFGSEDFYDYVIVEGSLNLGLTWQPLADGYDVRYSDLWAPEADLTQPPALSQFVNHQIDLMNTFSAGDEILIRFRMQSDNAVAGWGWVVDNLRIQSELLTSSESGDIPDHFALLPGYPNPFQKETTITYTLPEPAQVSLSIFDINGRLVQQLVSDEPQSAGKYAVSWDGKTPWGTPAASGVYFYRLDAGDAFRETRQLVKVR